MLVKDPNERICIDDLWKKANEKISPSIIVKKASFKVQNKSYEETKTFEESPERINELIETCKMIKGHNLGEPIYF